MIERLLLLRLLCEQFAAVDTNFFLRPEIWHELNRLKDLLKKPFDVIVKLQGFNITPGEFLKEWCKLKTYFDKNTGPIAEDIKKSVEKREEKLFDNNIFLAAVYVDAIYRILLEAAQIIRAKQGFNAVAEKIYKRDAKNIIEINTADHDISIISNIFDSNSEEDDDFEKELDEKEKRINVAKINNKNKDSFYEPFMDDCMAIEAKGRFKIKSAFEGIEQYLKSIQETCNKYSNLFPSHTSKCRETFFCT